MSSLPAQPYEVKDFSGGLTENFIAGGPTRYMAADNFWVTVDKKLEERYGSAILDSVNYQLPSGNSPVNSFISHDNEQYLLAISCPNLYVKNPNWALISGPTGNPALVGGNYGNAVSSAEWSHNSLITNDSLNTNPIRVFRGAAYPTTLASAPTSLNNFNAVTAGLPTMVGSQNISNSALLNMCIALANDLQSNMIQHINNYGSPINTYLHQNHDSGDATLLSTAAISPPVDAPSLYTFISYLIIAYNTHVSDVINNPSSPSWHWPAPTNNPEPLNFLLNTSVVPTTLIQAAAMLDDMKTKFFMHQMAPFTHDQYNNYAVTGKYLVLTPHIGTISTGPILNPSYAQSIALANSLKAKYNSHCADTSNYHLTADVNDSVTFPNAVDLDSLYILITLIRAQYSNHIADSALAHYSFVASLNSSTTTTITTAPSVGNIAGYYIWDLFTSSTLFASRPVKVVSESYPSIVTNVSSTTTGTGKNLSASLAEYHVTANTDLANEQLGTNGLQQYLTYAPNNANLSNYLALLTACITAFNAHDTNGTVHLSQNIEGSYVLNYLAPTIGSYAYALHNFYQYMRYDGVIFQVVGTPAFIGPIFSEAPAPAFNYLVAATAYPSNLPSYTYYVNISIAQNGVTISNIPTISNGSQYNYDTANTQVRIFRTINAGSTYYNCGIVSNGTSSFYDTLPDANSLPNVFNPLVPGQLVSLFPGVVPLTQYVMAGSTNSAGTTLYLAPLIYTSGNVVNFDQAPVCKYVTILNNTAFFGAIIDTGQTFLNRIRQSIPNAIDSSPGSFYVDLPDILTGLSNTRNNLVAFCKNSTYQVTGGFTQTGQGQLSYQSISDTIGCVSNTSIVRTDVGIFFAGTDGFYYTDGFQLIKLSSELNLTYASLVSNSAQQKAIYGCYDRYNRRVWWSTQPNPSDYSATQSYIFHVNFGVNANGVFTTASNYDNYRPSAMIFFQGQQIRGDARGYIFLHSNLSKTDPQVNISTTPTSWNTVYIPYKYASCAFDFGTTFNRKWLTRMSLQGKNEGNVAVQVTSVSDNGRVSPLTLAPMWSNKNIQWGQPNLIWGAPNSLQPIVWGGAPQIDMWRRFPATQLRADYKQLLIQPAKIGVYQYANWPSGAGCKITANGNGTASVQIITPIGYTAIVWPSDVVGYVFAQQSDNFTAEYPITTLTTTVNTNDTFVVSDPNNVLTTSYVAWIIRGILKQQRLSITSYNIHFTLLGKMQQAYHGSTDAGENPSGTSYNQVTSQTLDTESGQPIETEGGEDIII